MSSAFPKILLSIRRLHADLGRPDELDRGIVEKAECLGKFLWLRGMAMLSSPKSVYSRFVVWGVGRLCEVKRGNAAWGRKNRHV